MKTRLLPSALLAAGATPAQQAIHVTIEPVRISAQPDEVSANGAVVSESAVTIRTRVDGQNQQAHVTRGHTKSRKERTLV